MDKELKRLIWDFVSDMDRHTTLPYYEDDDGNYDSSTDEQYKYVFKKYITPIVTHQLSIIY